MSNENQPKGISESTYQECLDALEMLIEVFASNQIVTLPDNGQEVQDDE